MLSETPSGADAEDEAKRARKPSGADFSLQRRRTHDEAVDGPLQKCYDGESGSDSEDGDDDASMFRRASSFMSSLLWAGDGEGGAAAAGEGLKGGQAARADDSGGRAHVSSASTATPGGNASMQRKLSDLESVRDPDALFGGCDRRASAKAVDEQLGTDLVGAQERLPTALRGIRRDLWSTRVPAKPRALDARAKALDTVPDLEAALTRPTLVMDPSSPWHREAALAAEDMPANASGAGLLARAIRAASAAKAPVSPRRRAEFVLHVVVHRAIALPDVQLVGVQDPYIRVGVCGARAPSGGRMTGAGGIKHLSECVHGFHGEVAADEERPFDGAAAAKQPSVIPAQWKRTTHIPSGGTDPSWADSTVDGGLEYQSHMLFPLDAYFRGGTSVAACVLLQVWNANVTTSDELIGVACVNVPGTRVDIKHNEARPTPHKLDKGGEIECSVFLSRNFFYDDNGRHDQVSIGQTILQLLGESDSSDGSDNGE